MKQTLTDEEMAEVNARLAETADTDDVPFPSNGHAEPGHQVHDRPGGRHRDGNHHRQTGELLDRKPPSDEFAERNVLGTILANPPLFDEHEIFANLFSQESHRKVVAHVGKLREHHTPIDVEHLVQSLRESGDLERIGGASAMADIINANVTRARFGEYLAQIRDKAARREVLHIGTGLIQGVHSDAPTADLLADARESLAEIEADNKGGVTYNRITSAQLASAVYDIQFHIPGIIVANQPQGIFGAKKSLKTNLMLDMAISIATGRHFLGYFHVEHPAKVGVFSGESGMPTIQETCRRICAAAKLDLADTGIVFSDTLPTFGSLPHMEAFEKFLVKDGIELVFIDPVYLSMLTAGNEGSLFAMGALLRSVSEMCQRIGVTPVLLHHMKKSVVDPYRPGDLDDASWSGFAEFCRGWLLINRREEYEPGSGMHRLWLSVGGSVGHSGLWGLDIFEGVYNGPGSRVWDVQVLKPDDVRQEAGDLQAKAKAEKQTDKLHQAKRALANAMAKYPNGETARVIRDTAGVGGTVAALAFAALLQDGSAVPCELLKPNRKTPYEGYKLKASDEPN